MIKREKKSVLSLEELRIKSISFFSVISHLHLHTTDCDRDWFQRVCGIFDTNAFDLSAWGGRVDVTGVFPNAAMMMHSCIKNTRTTFR